MRGIGFVSLLLVLSIAASIAADGPATPAGAAAAAPTLNAPADGATLPSFGPTLSWSNPTGATQLHLQVRPYKDEGPGVDLYFGSTPTSFAVPAPPNWYGLLPDMSYTWRVRVSDAATGVELTDPSWSPWAERTFRTPKVNSTTLTALTPAAGDVVTTLGPAIQWDDSRPDLFYYEFQLSKDRDFGENPATATEMVYSALLHGGVTSPFSAYQVPAGFALQDSSTYYWRVRPRVQGDGAPVAWSTLFNFRTDTTATPALRAQPAVFGAAAADASCRIANASSTFAANPSLTGLHYAYTFSGAGTVAHNWYLDERPGTTARHVLRAGESCRKGTFGRPDAAETARPLPVGKHRIEVWYAGQRVQSTEFTVSPSVELGFGPITVGTADDGGRDCRQLGAATSFPAGIERLYVRYNRTGTGPYTAAWFRNGNHESSSNLTAESPTTCNSLVYGPAGGLRTGAWEFRLVVAGATKRSVAFTVQ